MDAEPNQSEPQAGPPPSDAPQAGNPPLAAAAGPWEEYLVGKKVPAEGFLSKLTKGPIPVPDNLALERFAEAVATAPERVGRLVSLLRASRAAGDSVRRIVSEFAEASVKRLGVPPPQDPSDPAAFRESVSSWVDRAGKKPLKTDDLRVLLLALHLGYQRGLCDHDTAMDLVASAACRPARRGTKDVLRPTTFPVPLEVVLGAEPTGPVLAGMVAYSKACEARAKELDGELEARDHEISRLQGDCARLRETVERLRSEVASLEEVRSAAMARVADLERQIVDLGDGWQHRLGEVRGRARGFLQGQLTRWLQTALDAARSDPPFIKAVEERLEDALRTTDGELQWLQRSD